MSLVTFTNVQQVTDEYATAVRAGVLREIIARQAGELLTNALLDGTMDTDGPIWLFADHSYHRGMNTTSIKVTITATRREPHRDAVEARSKALDQ